MFIDRGMVSYTVNINPATKEAVSMHWCSPN
jgi:hypothetical protein